MMKCKFIEAMAIACIFLQIEEMYPDQEKALIVHSLSSGKVVATPILKSVPSQFSPFIP